MEKKNPDKATATDINVTREQINVHTAPEMSFPVIWHSGVTGRVKVR